MHVTCMFEVRVPTFEAVVSILVILLLLEPIGLEQ